MHEKLRDEGTLVQVRSSRSLAVAAGSKLECEASLRPCAVGQTRSTPGSGISIGAAIAIGIDIDSTFQLTAIWRMRDLPGARRRLRCGFRYRLRRLFRCTGGRRRQIEL